MDARSIGQWGEDMAEKYLRRRLYKIVARNYRCRMGEIDVIAQRGGEIVFVEVKTRKNAAYAEAKDFVDPAKQRRILNTAQVWLAENDCELQPRFDVIEVYAPNGPGGKYRVNHIEEAFP